MQSEQHQDQELIHEVLTHCKLPDSIDVNVIKSRIFNYITAQEEYYRDTKSPLIIESGISEWITSNASKGTMIGGGSCAMDVKTQENEGIDVMCVIMNKTISNEKSLHQNFKSSGANLDTLFNDKKDNEALSLYMNDLYKKLNDVKNTKNLTDLYILAYISTYTNVYLSCFKINLECIHQVTSGGFVTGKVDDKPSVNIVANNFINSTYGKVNLYKSKKRIELRLLPEIINSEHTVMLYSLEAKE